MTLALALVASMAMFAQRVEPTFIAVVRHDGSMIPGAAHDGAQWWNRWPSDFSSRDRPDLPSSLETIPSEWLPPATRLPSNWRVQALDGSNHRIRAIRPIRTFMMEDDQAIGLQSDFKWKPVGDRDTVLAVAGAGTIGRFVEPSEAESRRVLGQLASRLRDIEREAMTGWLKEHELPATTQLREVYRSPADKNSPTFALSRAQMPFKGRTYYHLTGQRLLVWKPGDDEHSCKVNLSFSGSLAVERDGRLALEHVTAFPYAEFCGDAAEDITPIGTWQSNDQLLWIATSNLEDGFDYFVMDPQTGEALSLRQHPFD
jgi:hypothetical protein